VLPGDESSRETPLILLESLLGDLVLYYLLLGEKVLQESPLLLPKSLQGDFLFFKFFLQGLQSLLNKKQGNYKSLMKFFTS
jgi:hypothetical protein